MRIIVDADACPVKNIIETEAKKRDISVIMICNINHDIFSTYSEIIRVDSSFQAADIAIINKTLSNDIVVTQDYGLASLVLEKGARAISPYGKVYTLDNIDNLLMQRHINLRAREAGMRTFKQKKRNNKDDEKFRFNFIKLLDG